ncbi:MAG: ATP-binding protein [Granulosicoccaceae bacterium]
MNPEILEILDQVDAPIFILSRSSQDEPVYVAINTLVKEKAKLSREDWYGKTAKQIYPGKFGELAYTYHRECMASGKKASYELTIPLDGQDTHVRTVLIPKLDAEGKVERIVGTANIVDAEYKLREIQMREVELNVEMEQLISLSAHDLRSPMRNMHYLADMLREGFVDLGDGKLRLVELLQKVSKNTDALVGEIINFAQSSSTAESIEAFSLTSLCRKIISTLDPDNQHQSAVEDIEIFGDRISTQIVLRNLIDNAIKHNKDKSIFLEISAKATDSGFEITVCDNGEGLADPSLLFKNEVPRVIDKSFGLFAISRLVRSRGGDIWACPRENCSGLAVVFSLPGEIR